MKYFLLSLLGVLVTLTAPLGQAQDSKVVCLDIIEKVDSNTVNGSKVLVWQCCGGIKLFAKLRVLAIGRSKKTFASNWRAEDMEGAKLEMAAQERIITVPLKGNLSQRIKEQMLVIKSQNICFVIKRDIVR
jgi:hypothetical protein